MADVFHVGDASAGERIYQYDDSFEGLMTAVFDSYAHRPAPIAIVGQQHQQQLGAQYMTIDTDESKAARVIAGIRRKMGGDVYERVWTGFLSCNPDKGNIIYQYIRLGMTLGPAVRLHITDDRVVAMDKLASLVGKESSQLIEFVRFSRMEGGVYYSKITPDNDVITLMMPFFADRFNTQPFLIHDLGRQIAGVYDTHSWFVTSTEEMNIPAYSDDEQRYRQLWKRFYDTIAIKERINPGLRRQHMPKKFWRHITEMTMEDSGHPTLLPSDISRAGTGVLRETAAPQLPHAENILNRSDN